MGGVIIQPPFAAPSHLPRIHPKGVPPELETSFVAVRAIAPPTIPGIAEVAITLDTTAKDTGPLLVPPKIRALALADVAQVDDGFPLGNQLAVDVCVKGHESGIQLTGATAPAT